MSDEIDQANDLADENAARRIKEIREAPPVALPTGFCLECGEPVPAGHRWCNADCRDMWCARNEK